MALTVSSGVVDAISFIAFHKIFTAFMTGNLVFLGLGAANAFAPGGPDMVRVSVAIAAFVVGVFVAARIIRRSRGSRLPAQGFPLALAGVLIAQVVFLGGWIVASGDPSDAFATGLAGIEAFAMGMQSSAVGSLDVKGVFTTAATATLVNLSREAADPRVSSTSPVRLARILVCLIVGATVGGLLFVHARLYAPVVPALATAAALALTLADRPALRGGRPAGGERAAIDSDPAPAPQEKPAVGYSEAA
jgi:uncharacterized membrane protein YoaK (UPF0700 family)